MQFMSSAVTHGRGNSDAQPLAQAERQRQATRPGPVVRGTFSLAPSLAPCRRRPVSSNYKGFPRCQAKPGLDRIAQRSIKEDRTSNRHAGVEGVEQRAKCGLEKLQPVIVQHGWLRTLMKKTRAGDPFVSRVWRVVANAPEAP